MMYRTGKKTFSLLLVVSMIFSMFGGYITVSATEISDITTATEPIDGQGNVIDSGNVSQIVETNGGEGTAIVAENVTPVAETDDGEGNIPDEGFGGEDEPVITETGVTSAEELESALANGYDRIQLLADITLDRTFVVDKSTVIYATEAVTLTRSVSFGGDLFVVGAEEIVTVTFGDSEKNEKDLIVIDGNKDNMEVDVVGTVFLVKNLADVELRGITVTNAKKVGNERILDEEVYDVTYKSQVGGAAVILDSGKMDIYDSKFIDNEVSVYETDTTDSISGRGAAIYSFGELNIYNSAFTNNHATKGGAVYSYRETHLTDTTFEGNTASTMGGAVYVPSSTSAFLYTDNVTFMENSATDGGAILAYGTCDLKNTSFMGNQATVGHGGAIYVSGKKTDKKSLVAENVTFTQNTASKSAGAIYVDSGAVVSLVSDAFEGNQAQGASGGAVYIKATASALIDGATFTGNKTLAGHGGAITVVGTAEKTERNFELYNSSFTENQSSNSGGALYFSTNAIAYLENVTFTKNEALAEGGTKYGGGAIYSTGSKIDADGVEFIENKSGFMGGAFEMHSSSVATMNNVVATGNVAENSTGGAFEIQSSSTISMNNVTASGNTALNDRGGFMDVKTAEAKIWNSVIEGSSAKVGGAIAYQEGSKGGIYNTEFAGNQSANQGGALHIYTNGEKVTLHTVKFSNNVAGSFGGAVYISKASLSDMYNITAKGNQAESGGFMYETTTGTVVNLNGLTVSGNSATNGNIIYGNSAGAKLNINKNSYVDEDMTGDLDDIYWAGAIANSLTVTNVISFIPGYKDFGEEGGEDEGTSSECVAGVMSGAELESALAQGYGKIQIMRDFSLDRTIELTNNTTIFANDDVTLTRAAGFGGDMFIFGPAQRVEGADPVNIMFGGGEGKIIIDGNKDNMSVDVVGSVFFVRNDAVAEIRNVTVANARKTGNASAFNESYGLSYASQVGGAAVILASGKLDIYNAEFANNEVSIYAEDTNDSISGRGGAIYSFGELNVYNSVFKNNKATKAGAIYNYKETHLTDMTFEGNTASTLGGAFYVPSSTGAFVYTDNVSFKGNSATAGGAIYNLGTVGFADTSFTENEATDGNGGALYLAGKKTKKKSLEAENVIFTDNVASKAGGAVYATSASATDADGNAVKIGPEMRFYGAVFSGNKANGGHGGAVWVAGGDETDIKTLEIYNGTFGKNQTSQRGGGLYFGSKAASYMEDVIFTENRALADNGTAYGGGAIYSTGSSVEINGGKFIKNVSDYIGGAIELRAGSAVVLNDITAEENTSVANGGFMYANNSSLKIYNSYIKGNVSSSQGGAIDMQALASGEIHKTKFIDNKANGTNGGALVVYTNGKNVTLNQVLFDGNTSANFGGAIYVSNKSLLDLYNIKATGNSAPKGGFMYETTSGTVVNLNGLIVSGNTATTGGPIIWGNTTNAKLYINKANYADLDVTGELNDAYWASAIVNLLTVNDLSGEAPKAEDYSDETTDNMDEITDVRTIDELETALLGDAKNIRVTSNIMVDRTLYVIGEKVLFSTTKKTIKRSPDFRGDMFVVGEDKNGNYPISSGIETIFTLGNPESETENLLVIDGNRYNMTGEVTGSAMFVAGNAKVNIYKNTSIINHYKNGAGKILDEKYGATSAMRAGGAAIVNIDGIISVYGGLIKDNIAEAGKGVDETGTEIDTAVNGGAIHNRGTFVIYGGTFQSNEGTYGGLMYNLKRVDILGGKFIENHAFTNGGAIYSASTQYAHLYIGKSEGAGVSDTILFKNNVADSSGAALYNSVMGAVIITGDTTFEENFADASGGAIATYGTLNVNNTRFINNSAKTRGGAVYTSNSNEVYTTRIVNVTNSIFEGNKSTVGGAVAVYSSNTDFEEGGIIEIDSCTFKGNQATNLTDKETTSVFGGVIYNSRRGSVTVSNSSFTENTAEYEGGVIYAAGESKNVVTNSTFTRNSTTAEKGRGGVLSVHSATVEFDGTTFEGNSALSNGGAFLVSYTTANTVNSTVKVNNSVFSGNTSGGNGGAIYATEHVVEEDKPVLIIKDTDFNNNISAEYGGAVYMTAKVDSYMKNVDFAGNKAGAEDKKTYGGAIYMTSGSSLELDTATFTNNEASYCGGGIALHSASEIMFNNVTADGNTAMGSAGFLYGNDAKITIFDSLIKNNTTGSNGGGMALYNGTTLAAYGVTFDGNKAPSGAGGAIADFAYMTEALLHSCVLSNNEAGTYGGAVYLNNEGILNIYNTEATYNKADKGGFMYETTTGTEATIRNLTLDGNSATTDGDIIFGNTYGANLYIDKMSVEDKANDNAGDDAYWDYAIKNKLTVIDISGTDEEIPERLEYIAQEDTEEEEEERKLVPVSKVLELGKNSSDADINSTYGSLPRLDNSSNFMSKETTTFDNINGETVTVDTFVYHPDDRNDNVNFGMGMLLYQAILYKDAHPEEDVKVSIAQFRFEMETAICINRNSRYFGYMRNLVGADYDKYGFVRISYLLVTAAKMGIDVTVMGQIPGYPHNSKDPDFIGYFEDKVKDPCDPAYVGEGKTVEDYMHFVPCEWTSYGDKGGSDMMHLKMATASHYLDMNGVAHENAIFTSTSNLDGINSNGTNGNNKIQVGTLVSDHDGLYRTASNYINLLAEYRGQEEVYIFRSVLADRTAEQFELIQSGRGNEIPADKQIVYLGTENDDVFELYFTPFGGEPNAWNEKYNPYCKYVKKLANSEDYITLAWNNANYLRAGLVGQIEDMIISAFHNNKNPNNKIYINLAEFDTSAFADLKLGVDIGLMNFNNKEFGGLHCKDLQLSYVEDGQRKFVTLFNTLNFHSGAISYQSNSVLVVKENSGEEGSVYFALADNTTNGMVEHNYSDKKTFMPETDEDGYAYKECEHCGKTVIIDTVHRSGDWIVAKEASESEKGMAYRKCNGCGMILSVKEIVGTDAETMVIDYTKSDVGLNLSSADSAYSIAEAFASKPKTFEANFLLPKSVSERAGVLVGNYDGTRAEQINVEIYTNGKPRLYYKVKNKAYTYLFTTDVRSDISSHLAITIDGLTATLYLNGVEKETVTLGAELANACENYKIGADCRAADSPYFKGTIYSVAIFDDARTAEEIGLDMILVPDEADGLLFSKYFADSASGLDNMFADNISYDGAVWTCDLSLFSNETVCGNVYAAVYEGDKFIRAASFAAAEQVPVRVECSEGQMVKIFWWDSELAAQNRELKIMAE